jgi:type VI secretion system secreted protein Hcp
VEDIMAVDTFLKIVDINGEAKDKAHKDEIDVLAWSWGMSQSATSHLGGGGGSGKVAVQDLSITKFLDKATPNLMLYCCNGIPIPKVWLTVRKAGKEPLEYMKITMEDCLISNVSTGGSGSEDRLTENIMLNFAKVEVEYTPQKADGSGDPSIIMSFDIAQNS